MVHEIDRLLGRLDELEGACPERDSERIAALEAGLKKLEWMGTSSDGFYEDCCPACDAQKDWEPPMTHDPDCWLAALLKGERYDS